MMGLQSVARKGRSASDWMLLGLITVVAVLSLYAIARAVDTQHQAREAFTGWYQDAKGHKKAMADQQATGKPILVYFYADWCPHCKRFAAEILSTPKTRDFVKNYPHVRIAPDNGKAERKLMDEYGAEGYPTFYVVLPDGKRVKVDTHTESAHEFRLKTPQEFNDTILAITGGQ